MSVDINSISLWRPWGNPPHQNSDIKLDKSMWGLPL